MFIRHGLSKFFSKARACLTVLSLSLDPHACICILHIWDHLGHMYSGTGNITWIYELCKQYFGLKQGTQTMDECYN
jgi:hypothetical protein